MGDPQTRQKRAMTRKRNFIAKKLREDPRFRPKRIPNKRKDDDGDYEQLHEWLKRPVKYVDNAEDKEYSASYGKETS